MGMNTWAPLFSRIVDSSLWCEPDHVVKVFLTMVAKKDADHVVRGSAFNIAQWAKKTEKETLDALKILQAPDSRRIEKQAYDGRRVEKVAGGWLILNGQYYQDLMRSINRKAYKAAKQKEYRQKSKASNYAAGEAEYVVAEKKGATQEQLDTIQTRRLPEQCQ